MDNLGVTNLMGPQLREEVKKQLLENLQFYGIDRPDLEIDWSTTVPEGHATRYLDGQLENWSGVGVLDTKNNLVAAGWIEFILDEQQNALFVYWQFLCLVTNKEYNKEYSIRMGMPRRVWNKLSDRTKERYLNSKNFHGFADIAGLDN